MAQHAFHSLAPDNAGALELTSSMVCGVLSLKLAQ
jgi:hypothetical protein